MTAAAAQPLEPLCIHLHDSDPARLGEGDEVAQARIVARGLRVDLDDGFGLVPQAIVGAMTKLQSHSTSNPTSISQKAAVEALRGPQESVGIMLAEYKKRRDFVVNRLRQIPGVKCAEPRGAFYAYPNIAASFARGIRDTMDFSVRLLENAHVAVVPGEAFGTKEHIRISYATSLELLEKGLGRIAKFMEML